MDGGVAGAASLLGRRSVSFSGAAAEEVNGEDDLSDEFSPAGEKKRRLNVEQVRTLERNFEMGNRLEPERKVQLARALGLQPRQVAIWFQNRRARWKTKQLEKDYDALKRQVDAIREENRSLQSQNQKLEAEVIDPLSLSLSYELGEPMIPGFSIGSVRLMFTFLESQWRILSDAREIIVSPEHADHGDESGKGGGGAGDQPQQGDGGILQQQLRREPGHVKNAGWRQPP